MKIGMPFLLELTSPEEAAALCRELGLDFVELNLNFPACQLEALDVQELYRLRRQYGVGFTLHLEEECDPLAFNPAVRRAWLESIRRTLILAQALECPVVNMHWPRGIYITLPTEKVFLYERYADDYRAAVEAFADVCRAELQGSGVRLAIENTNGFTAWEKDTLRDLMQEPCFGLTLDIGHSHAVQDVDLPFFREQEGKLIHMHVHDAQGTRNHLPLDEGESPWRERLHWACEKGASAVLETKTVAALRHSVGILKREGLMNEKC